MDRRDTPAALETCSPPHSAHDLALLDGPQATLERATRLFRALGDEGRLRLLMRLATAPACVTELAKAEGQSLPTMSQRLRALRNERLVTSRRDGQRIIYALADVHVLIIVRMAVEHSAETEQPIKSEEHQDV